MHVARDGHGGTRDAHQGAIRRRRDGGALERSERLDDPRRGGGAGQGLRSPRGRQGRRGHLPGAARGDGRGNGRGDRVAAGRRGPRHLHRRRRRARGRVGDRGAGDRRRLRRGLAVGDRDQAVRAVRRGGDRRGQGRARDGSRGQRPVVRGPEAGRGRAPARDRGAPGAPLLRGDPRRAGRGGAGDARSRNGRGAAGGTGAGAAGARSRDGGRRRPTGRATGRRPGRQGSATTCRAPRPSRSRGWTAWPRCVPGCGCCWTRTGPRSASATPREAIPPPS